MERIEREYRSHHRAASRRGGCEVGAQFGLRPVFARREQPAHDGRDLAWPDGAEGEIHRRVPPVVAVAEAGEGDHVTTIGGARGGGHVGVRGEQISSIGDGAERLQQPNVARQPRPHAAVAEHARGGECGAHDARARILVLGVAAKLHMAVGERAEQLVGTRPRARRAAEAGVDVGAAREQQAEDEGSAEWTNAFRRGAGIVGRRRQGEIRRMAERGGGDAQGLKALPLPATFTRVPPEGRT